ncbi:DUF2235 domain-containing protein [Pseudaestuariivita sp.]|uniref:DUF2235 domain-containing protein n=1 Tax=Pseudaestuariivita sp. TaxID=2211669 RepID=UPI004058ADD4
MKRIALFCDGTWNRSDARLPTNVVQLAQAVAPTAPDGVKQQVFYMPGVGSGRGSTRLSQVIDRIGGGAFGWGLTENIVEAYRNLVFCYEPGDEIYVFGFSRGAYTARSLCGLLRSTGLPDRAQLRAIPGAIARYRSRDPDTKPDTRDSNQFRAILSPHISTSEDERAWRLKNGYGESHVLRIKYLGVWDTVGAMGLPGIFGAIARRVNRKHAFHDQRLTRLVAAARHGVALDERRKLYPPTLWDDKLIEMNGDATGDARPYQQVWFPGNHRIIGGAGNVPGLSSEVALWMAAGARREGLVFEEARMQRILENADPLAGGAAITQQEGALNLFGRLLRDRDGPDHPDDVSMTAKLRVRELGYAPQSLARVMDRLRS